MAWFEHASSRIYYEEAGSGDPLLLLPGWSRSIEDMQAIRQALTPRHRVIAADLPGSGRSLPQPRTYTAPYHHDDSRALLALLDELGAGPAHVVGYSDGGDCALLMAVLNPAAVRSVISWGAAGQFTASMGIAETLDQVVDNPAPPLQDFSSYLKSTYGEDNARIMARSAAKAIAAIIDAGGDISRQRADEIACPALLIAGEHDDWAPPPLVSEMAAAMQRGQFIEVKGAGHAIHREQLDWLTRTIVDWLAER